MLAPNRPCHPGRVSVSGTMPTVMTCVLRAPLLLPLLLLLLLLGCAPVATAISLSSARLPAETLIADARIPVFQNGQWVIMSPEEHHYYVRRSVARRAREDATATTTVEFAVSTATSEPTSTTAVAASPLPSPLDTVGSNFTGDGGSAACPSFINSFLANPTFKQCYPFSMLLQVRTCPPPFSPASRATIAPPVQTLGPPLTLCCSGLLVLLRSREVARDHHAGPRCLLSP